ncbi:MAG: hypothetical protein LBE62_14990 [Azonexus sp.]|jgi:hypothetical protein|nr:hypothetical protein [Azonexus sp.]
MDSEALFFALLLQLPWRGLALDGLIGAACGLTLGLLVMAALRKTGLLQRNKRWLGHALKLYWLFIPGLLAVTGLQVGLAHGVWRGADQIIVVGQTPIQEMTRSYLGELQSQLDHLIEQSPSLKDASIYSLVDAAIDRSLLELPAADSSASITADPAAYAVAWCVQAVRSAYLRQKLRDKLVETVQKASGADQTSVEMALQTSLGQMAEDNVIYHFLRERLRLLFWSIVQSVLLMGSALLLIPGVEIGLSKWRRW